VKAGLAVRIKLNLFGVRKDFAKYALKDLVNLAWGPGSDGCKESASKLADIKLYLASFADGGEDYWIKSKIFKRQAIKTGWFSGINIYNFDNFDEVLRRTDLQKSGKIKKFIEDYKHIGGGYWLWKPIIILDRLQSIEEGAVLMYADIGCEFSSKGTEILNKMLSDVLVAEALFFSMPFVERHWTAPNFLKYMSATMGEQDSGQISATYFYIKNSPNTRAFVKKWIEIACCENFAHLMGHVKLLDFFRFIEHRHDQSILSLLVKRSKFKITDQVDHFDKEMYKTKNSAVMRYPVHSLRSLSEVLPND
jgi:hypothetical protein